MKNNTLASILLLCSIGALGGAINKAENSIRAYKELINPGINSEQRVQDVRSDIYQGIFYAGLFGVNAGLSVDTAFSSKKIKRSYQEGTEQNTIGLIDPTL